MLELVVAGPVLRVVLLNVAAPVLLNTDRDAPERVLLLLLLLYLSPPPVVDEATPHLRCCVRTVRDVAVEAAGAGDAPAMMSAPKLAVREAE